MKPQQQDHAREANVFAPAVAVEMDPQYVDLQAPATLLGGYELTVEVDGGSCVVLVPEGGVEEGQLFRAEVLRRAMVAESVETATGKNNNLHNIPEGHWRDGLCDCFVYGCCHPLCCLAFWFKPLALGQVMTRLNLSSSSCNPAPREKSTSWSPFTIMVVIVILYIVINPFILIILNITTGNDSTFISMLQLVLRIAFGLFILLSTCKTRAYIRRKYNIPETSCDGCEDCCCAFWCGCCTVTQMARHTADYNTYHAFCCSETGLNDSAPHIV